VTKQEVLEKLQDLMDKYGCGIPYGAIIIIRNIIVELSKELGEKG